jgi:hypothetical protein
MLLEKRGTSLDPSTSAIVDTFAAEDVIRGHNKISPDFDDVECTPAAYEADE